MSFSISIKKFRTVVDRIQDERAAIMVKTAYLLAARNSEILTKTTPFDLLRNASKPYGTFLKFGFQTFEEEVEGSEPIREKCFVVTCAVAKRGKRLKTTKETPELEEAEVIEALTKYKQTKLLDQWQAGEIELDPLLIKVLLGKVTLKIVALPTSLQYEPWTMDLLKWIRRYKTLSFPITRNRFWQILRESIPRILPKKGKGNIKNPLRHFRIAHLVEYYGLDPYELTTYAGWTARSTFGQLGIAASPNIDVYAHLRWRLYIKKLLKPIEKFTK